MEALGVGMATNRVTCGLASVAPQKNHRIVFAYVVLALVWIASSDVVLEYLFISAGGQTITHWQTLKGALFVIGTGIGLHMVLRRFAAAGERIESLFRTMFEDAGLGIALIDKDSQILEANPALAKFCGCSRSELTGHSIEEYTYANDLYKSRHALDAVATGTSDEHSITERYVRKDGTIVWGRLTMSTVKEKQGGARFFIAMIEDISREKLAEEDLRASERKVRRFIDSELLGIAFWDRQRRIADANSTYLKMLGYTAEDFTAGQLSADDLLPPNCDSPLPDVSVPPSSTRVEPFEKELVRKDGVRLPVLIGGTAFGEAGTEGVAFVLDISALKQAREEAKRLEEQLRQAEKLNALGRLAGGIAHDMNNLLSVIVGYASLLDAALKPDDPLRANTRQILTAAGSGGALVRQMLAFSRKQVFTPQPMDIQERLQSTVTMLRPLLGEGIELTIVPAAGLPPVKADAAQIDQVLVNLILNARDAMPNGGKIAIQTHCVAADRNYPAALDLQRGQYVVLSVMDSGTGMDAATQAKIFEPFFTTKKGGQGTGLGLAVVYGIVSQSGGRITVTSEVGQGSRFDVYLPVATADSDPKTSLEQVFPARTATGTILLAEDGSPLRNLLAECLGLAGFRVLQCRDGQQAIETARQYAGRIDLMISDLGMPKVGGIEAVSIIGPTRPEMKVLFISGYVDSAVPVDSNGNELPLLLKPFTPDVLATKIHEVLSKPADGRGITVRMLDPAC
jgi:PAS domain S-box-containing protein